MSLPCNHSNEPSAVFDGCANVVYNEISRKKVPVVDTQFVAKFIRFQDVNQLVADPLLIINTNNIRVRKMKIVISFTFVHKLI